jgi:WD40 repeat protein
MPPDSPSYVERRADVELLERITEGEFCYVLTPRQMGKSSLMARSSKRLREFGIRTAVIDLTLIGGGKEEVSAAQWYYGFIHELLKELRLGLDLEAWWHARANLPALQRLSEFFRDAVLAMISERIVVFVDEIDTTIGLPFADDFFAAIRACHNARAFQPEYKRLSFVLLGVATPPELIKDTRRTPFNVGHRIELTDFTPDEAVLLVTAGHGGTSGEQTLERIMYWTSGHPYLTQKLCRIVAEEQEQGRHYEDLIDELVDKHFLGPDAVRNEDNLKFVASRLQDAERSKALLRMLTHIRRGGTVVDDATSALHAALKLSGVVGALPDGRLAVRNRIYDRVFTEKWAKTDRLLGSLWRRRAIRYAATGDRDRALLSHLLALTIEQKSSHRQEAQRLAAYDYSTLLTTFRHAGPITAVAYSPNGKRIVTASEDHTARIWDVVSASPIGPPLRHRGHVWTVAISPDGQSLVTGSADCTARIWNINTGLPIGSTLRHRKTVWGVAFSPNGRIVMTSSDDHTARLWRADTGEPKDIVLAHEASVEAAVFSRDGMRIATAGSDNKVRLWNAESGSQIIPPLHHASRISVIAFSPDGRSVLTAGEDKVARLWDVETGSLMREVFHHEGWIRAAVFSPAGHEILTGGEDNNALLWSFDSGRALGPPLRHEHWVRAVGFSPDSNTVVTGSEDRTARLWSADMGLPIGYSLRHGGRVVATAFSHDGGTLLTGSSDHSARLWRVGDGKQEYPGPLLQHDCRVGAIAFGREGRTLLSGAGNAARIWNAETGALGCNPLLHSGAIRVVAFTFDGRSVLTGGDDNTAVLWSVKTGSTLGLVFRHGGVVRTAAIRDDGKVVATGSADHTARLWSIPSGEPIGAGLRHNGPVQSVLFSPNGEVLLTASLDNGVRLWTANNGELISPALFHEGPVESAAFSPDGKVIATGSYDNTARLWSAELPAPLTLPLKHEGPVRTIAFSPDGKVIATGSDDHTTRLWRVDSGAPIGRPLRGEQPVRNVAFSPDGRILVSATDDWVHAYLANGKPISSRVLVGVWSGAYHFASGSDAQLRIAMRLTPDCIVVADTPLNPSGEQLLGAPEALVEQWGTKLALRVDERDRIVPRWR